MPGAWAGEDALQLVLAQPLAAPLPMLSNAAWAAEMRELSRPRPHIFSLGFVMGDTADSPQGILPGKPSNLWKTIGMVQN